MAYMNQERKAKISAKMKPLLKKYGVKGTLSVRNHSTIVLNLKSGKVDFLSDYGNVAEARKFGIQVNPYWFHEHFVGTSKKFLSEAFSVLKSADWFDESDAQVDYFNTAYYVDVNIGHWNKPYQVEA
jgi:hypothetical protein